EQLLLLPLQEALLAGRLLGVLGGRPLPDVRELPEPAATEIDREDGRAGRTVDEVVVRLAVGAADGAALPRRGQCEAPHAVVDPIDQVQIAVARHDAPAAVARDVTGLQEWSE